MSIRPMTREQFQHIKEQLGQNPTRQQIADMYQQVRSYGHLYPNLAMGIVESGNSSLAGRTAVEHLQNRLGSIGKPRLSDAELVPVMRVMALGYLNQLENQFSDSNNFIEREILGTEALQLHNDGFQQLGYGREAWTLYLPYTVLGENFTNQNFVEVLNAAGNNGLEFRLSVQLAQLVNRSRTLAELSRLVFDIETMPRIDGIPGDVKLGEWLSDTSWNMRNIIDFFQTFPEALNPKYPEDIAFPTPYDIDQNGIPDAIQYPSPYNQRNQPTPWDLDGNGIPDSIQRDPIPEWQRELNRVLNFFRRDPLTLDLDGNNQLETLAENGSQGVMFDHDGDGIRTPTGWIGTNDGFLVLDHNGNGVIDNGTELFGDNYIKLICVANDTLWCTGSFCK